MHETASKHLTTIKKRENNCFPLLQRVGPETRYLNCNKADFDLNHRKNFPALRTVGQWHILSRDVMESLTGGFQKEVG